MKKMYWYIGIGIIALIFFVVPLKEGKTAFQYLTNYNSPISLG